jgi:predicted transcriptional regulator
MWRIFEPIHAGIYFYPPSAQSYRDLGLKGGWMGYFATRSASLGTPGKDLVRSIFYHFSPDLVGRAIPDAWKYTTSEQLMNTRMEVAHQMLSNFESHFQDSALRSDIDLLLEISRSLPCEGRPLFASLRGPDWETSPHLKIFGAVTLLREHRGDTHSAALASQNISGAQSNILQIANRAVSFEVISPNRGWSDQSWTEAMQDLKDRGIITNESTNQQPELTQKGQQIKNSIENLTDESSNPWSKISAQKLHDLIELLTPISDAVKESGLFPKENAIGL